MSVVKGELIAESPIYRGNARKTLFTRDGDGKQRLVSLAGEISGTAEVLMDAFIGSSRNRRNTGLLNQLWERLYGSAMPAGLISRVECRLQERCYTPERFFDLRMGIRLDEDRWAAEANANYKIETLFRNAAFDFALWVSDDLLKKEEPAARLYYLIQELQAGRFWFGAGKSKGLGRCRLNIKLPMAAPVKPPKIQPRANHLTISLAFGATNPVLVGWNWGKLDPETPAFAAIEGRLLVSAMREIPEPLRQKLAMVIGGPILSPRDWKNKLAEYLPRLTAVWLQEQSASEKAIWRLPEAAIETLGKGKFPLSKKILQKLQPLAGQPFETREALEQAILKALGAKKNMANRVLEHVEQQKQAGQSFDEHAWQQLVDNLGLAPEVKTELVQQIDDETAMENTLARACKKALPGLYQQVDRQVKMLQSDAWVDAETDNREEHLKIKIMLLKGEISETQWQRKDAAPKGVKLAAWQEFLDAHARVNYRHMLNRENLQKSIENDRNHIEFLRNYRNRVRQELAQPHHIDFRAGGRDNREISKEYGKPYDTIFMRMLSWSLSAKQDGRWEVYIPGSTLKGAFRKRASQVLKTLWGEGAKTGQMLERLFGAQGRRGLVFFSDAYLQDLEALPESWCSMDGVKMDPQTAEPIEEAKADYLFAFGDKLVFQLCLDIQDLQEKDLEAFALLAHLLQDFQNGDIPVGGEKASGFGWVKARLEGLEWRTGSNQGITARLFGDRSLVSEGIWQKLSLDGEAAQACLREVGAVSAASGRTAEKPPRAAQGFISHRAFGGHCGMLFVEAQVLTPINIKESGEPSFRTVLDGQPVNGWDFYAIAPPEKEQRGKEKKYALPAKSIRGMVRHIYAIASNCREDSPDIRQLNPTDSLFGWVGRGPNQAIAGRLAFSFGEFENPQFSWFKIPYPYGNWQFKDGEWKEETAKRAQLLQVENHWRLFPHAPLAPNVQQTADFRPDTAKASYLRAILPGGRCRFTVRFWNLETAELQRLIWCIGLEPGLAHKMGRARYLGFGSLQMQLQPQSYLIDWTKRYAGKAESHWQQPLQPEKWKDIKTIAHYDELRKFLNAEQI